MIMRAFILTSKRNASFIFDMPYFLNSRLILFKVLKISHYDIIFNKNATLSHFTPICGKLWAALNCYPLLQYLFWLWITRLDIALLSLRKMNSKWAPSSESVSSSIPSWQILTAHAQPFREARDLAFCLKVPLDSLLVWASSEGSGETARMRRLAWTFAARIGDKYQIRLTRSKWCEILVHSFQCKQF